VVARQIIAYNSSLFKVLMKESQIENDEEMVFYLLIYAPLHQSRKSSGDGSIPKGSCCK